MAAFKTMLKESGRLRWLSDWRLAAVLTPNKREEAALKRGMFYAAQQRSATDSPGIICDTRQVSEWAIGVIS